MLLTIHCRGLWIGSRWREGGYGAFESFAQKVLRWKSTKDIKAVECEAENISHAQKLRCEHFMVILVCMMHGTVLHVQQAGTFNIVDTRFAFFRWKHVLAIKNIEANDGVFVSLKRWKVSSLYQKVFQAFAHQIQLICQSFCLLN